jgi:pimeloyl-ACP methyl ester carboxylesterase
MISRHDRGTNTNVLALRQAFPERYHQRLETPYGVTHYESAGTLDRPIIVLIHGVSGPMSVWDETTKTLLAHGYRVIRYDLFGRGFSERKAATTYDLPLYVHQLESLLNGIVGPSPIALVGSSFGAIVASEFTLQQPKRVRGLVLIGPAGFPIKTPLLGKLRDVPLLGAALSRVAGKQTILEQNRKYFSNRQPPPDFWRYFEAQLDVTGTLDAMLATMRHAPVQSYVDSYRALGRSNVPVGVIWGRQDVTFPYQNHETLLAAIPSGRLVTIDEAAHLPQVEQPQPTNDAIVSYLESFPATPKSDAQSTRVAYPLPVANDVPKDLIDNTADFQDPFFVKFPTETRPLDLGSGISKNYLFPTFYSDVTMSAALFLADRQAATTLLPPGASPLRALPGKTIVAIATYHYGEVRGLTPYNEAVIAILLDRSTLFVVSMPVSTLENRIRGHKIWGLPKEVRRIDLRQIGADFVSTVHDASALPAFELRIPMTGKSRLQKARMTLRSVRDGAALESISESEGTFAVSLRRGALTIYGNSSDAQLLRKLGVSPTPLRTQFGLSVKSAFALPRVRP